MKKFIDNFKNSLTNHKFYKEKTGEEHSTGYSYLIKMALLVAGVIYLTMVLGLYFSGVFGKVRSEINEKIPVDVSVYIDKNGELSINQPTPYVVPTSLFEDEKKDNDKKEIHRKNFIVIDPTRTSDNGVFDAYDTVIFVSKDRVFAEKSNGEVRSYPLKNWSDTTINKEKINNLLNIAYKFAWVMMLLMIIPFTIMFFLTYLITAFFASIVLYFLLKKIYKPISFKQTMNCAMYGYTYAFLIGIVISIVSLSPFSGYFWTKVLITIIATAYFLAKKEITMVSSENPTPMAESVASNTTSVV